MEVLEGSGELGGENREDDQEDYLPGARQEGAADFVIDPDEQQLGNQHDRDKLQCVERELEGSL